MNSKMVKLKVKDLVVDPRVQRSLDQKRARRMALEFDTSAVGSIAVSQRIDDSLVIIDGQHRVAAAVMAGLGDLPVDCQVFTGLELSQEAQLFRLLNEASKVRPIDGFFVRLEEGEPVAVGINNIVLANGWVVANGTNHKGISAIRALEAVWKSDPDQIGVLHRTLGTITQAWGYGADGVNQSMLRGLGLLVKRHYSNIDYPRLARKLSQLGTAAQVLGKAKGQCSINGGQLGVALYTVVRSNYNVGLKGVKRLGVED